MTEARMRPPRSTAPNTTAFRSQYAVCMFQPLRATSRRYDSRGFPPTNVSSTSTSPDNGSASVSAMSWLRILLNILHAVLYVTPSARSNCLAETPHRVLVMR